MTSNVLYFHPRPLTEHDRLTIKLARLTRMHERVGLMIAVLKAREVLRQIADECQAWPQVSPEAPRDREVVGGNRGSHDAIRPSVSTPPGKP